MFWKVCLYLQKDLHVDIMAQAAPPKMRQDSISHELKGFAYKEMNFIVNQSYKLDSILPEECYIYAQENQLAA